MSGIGGTLLIAYAVESSAAVTGRRGRNAENRVGVIVGAAASGLAGIVVCLGLAERAEVWHWGLVDELAFAYAVASLGILALIVVLLPWVRYEELRGAQRGDDDD